MADEKDGKWIMVDAGHLKDSMTILASGVNLKRAQKELDKYMAGFPDLPSLSVQFVQLGPLMTAHRDSTVRITKG